MLFASHFGWKHPPIEPPSVLPRSVRQETVVKHGAEQVQIWRRSFDIPPPALEKEQNRGPVGSLLGKVIGCSMVDPVEYVVI